MPVDMNKVNLFGVNNASFDLDLQSVLGAKAGKEVPDVQTNADGPQGAKETPDLPPAGGVPEVRIVGVPSLGASVMVLISQVADDDRRAAAEAQRETTHAAAEQIRSQASDTRKQAITNLVLGLGACAVQFAVSLGTSLRSASALKSMGGVNANLSEAQIEMLRSMNSTIQAQGQMAGVLGSVMTQAKETAGGYIEAEIKEKDALIEELRGYRSQLEKLDETLTDLLRKINVAQNAIQESTNQTMTKILT